MTQTTLKEVTDKITSFSISELLSKNSESHLTNVIALTCYNLS